MEEKLVYSVPQAAKVLDLSTKTVYQMTHMEGFPAIRLGRRTIIPRAALEEWLSQQVRKGA